MPVIASPDSRYCPEFFHVATLDEAKHVILVPDGTGMTTDQRWDVETRWLMERVKFDDDDGLVIDYGCGIGRLSREIRNPVIGVDSSRSMLSHAEKYVDRPTFAGVSPHMLRDMVDSGLRASGAIAVWSLQHVLEIHEAIDLLMAAVKPGSPVWIVDAFSRLVPYFSRKENLSFFADDQIELFPLLTRWCDLESSEPMNLYPNKKDELKKFRRKTS